MRKFIFIFMAVLQQAIALNAFSYTLEGLPLCYWKKHDSENFGDYLSLKVVERIVGGQVRIGEKRSLCKEKRLLAIGSVLPLANTGDVIWGTGMSGKRMDLEYYKFKDLDVRAIRGPMTRQFLIENFNIECPEIYGDPALLIPYLFPEFKKREYPKHSYIYIPHYSEEHLFPKDLFPNIVYPTDPWRDIIRKILDAEFVISGSLHGIVVAEAYGIPARYLRISDHEPLFKFFDYYLSTNRSEFNFATTLDEALKMGGEPPFSCDLEKLYYSFPFDYWPNADFKFPTFYK